MSKNAKTQDVVKANTQNLSLVETQAPTQEVLNSDIIIPKLLLMQGLSEFVSERKKDPTTNKSIGQGDMVRSTTGEIVADPDTTVDIVPLKMSAEWRLEEKVGGKFEYRGTEPRTASNEDSPWEFKKDGADWKRTKVINLFALLPKDVVAYRAELQKAVETGEMPDLNKTLMPVVISFRSTSFNAGKKVATFYAQLRDILRLNPNVRPFHYTLELSCYQDKNDKGTYYVFDIGKTKKLAQDLVDEAARWYGILNTMKEIRVDATGEAEASSGADLSDNF
jgi:hypothetical protein